MWLLALAAFVVVVLAIVVYLWLGRRSSGGPPPQARAVPQATSAPHAAATTWTLSADSSILTRHVASTAQSLQLPAPSAGLQPVPGGALVLLNDGSFGRFTEAGALRPPLWQHYDATAIIVQDDRYFLVDQDGQPRWRIDPATGAVALLGASARPSSPDSSSPPSSSPDSSGPVAGPQTVPRVA